MFGISFFFTFCFRAISRILSSFLKSGRSLLQAATFKTMPGKIGTHNGKFHCDEALACFMLKCLGDFSDFSVVRFELN